MSVRFSIVTITWNAAGSLQRTLDSVASQHYELVEHLIVDGGSTDGTLEMAKNYQTKSRHQVVITSERDNGLYDAMNKGLRKATGDYILFLNAGDALHSSQTLEVVADAVTKCKDSTPAVVYGDTAIIDATGHFLHLRDKRPPEKLSWRSFRNGMLVCHQAFYARLDIARQVSYDLHYRYSADVDWCIRIMKAAETLALPIVNAHEVVADFEDGGATTLHHRESLKERFFVMCRHYGWLVTIMMHLKFFWESKKKPPYDRTHGD